jgi:hypothetical protein
MTQMVFSGVLFIQSLARARHYVHQTTANCQILFLHLPPRQRGTNRVMQVQVYLLAPPRLHVPPHQLRLAFRPSLDEQPNIIPELTCLNLSGRRLAALSVDRGIRVQASADIRVVAIRRAQQTHYGSHARTSVLRMTTRQASSVIQYCKCQVCQLPSSSPAKPVVRNRRHWQLSTNLVKPKRQTNRRSAAMTPSSI